MDLKLASRLLMIVPAVVLGLVLWFAPTVLNDGKSLDSPIILSIIGTIFSYYGLLFSVYAALQVKRLSDQYFLINRTPDIQKKLSQTIRAISEFRNEPAIDLMAQSFLATAPVTIRSASRIKNRNIEKIAKEAQQAYDELKLSIGQSVVRDQAAGQVKNYWEFHQKLSELLDEMAEQVKDARAIP